MRAVNEWFLVYDNSTQTKLEAGGAGKKTERKIN
jgi:hypothetical protein